jgi:hypothetical protein
VDITNPTDGQTLVFNAESGKWENGAGGGGVYMLDTTNLDTMTFDGQSYGEFWFGSGGVGVQFKLVDSSVISDFNLITTKYVDSGITYISPAEASVGTISAQDPASVANTVLCNTSDITAVLVGGDYILIPSNGSYAPGTKGK